MDNIRIALEFRKKYSTPFYTLFMITCGVLVIMDFILIGTGVSFINEMKLFEGMGMGNKGRGHPRGLQKGGDGEHEGEHDGGGGRKDGGFQSGIEKKVTVLLVFFTFVILIIAVSGICLVRNPVKGKCPLIIYGMIILFLGFIPMVVEGSGLLALAKISPQEIHELC